VRLPAYDEQQLKARRKVEKQAREAGNSVDDLSAEWIDLGELGVARLEELDDRVIEFFKLVELEEDIYLLGLRSTIDPQRAAALAERILEARVAFRERMQKEGLTDLVEPFDDRRYNSNATVAENLVFGILRGEDLDAEFLAQHPYVRRILGELGLLDPLIEAGRKVAATMIELFADLPPGHEFFERFSFISADDLPEFQAMLARISSGGIHKLSEEDRSRLLSLSFLMIPARHRLGVLDDPLKDRLLEARHAFSASLPDELRPRIEFFEPDHYNSAATVQDNILFGKRVFGQAHGQRRVGEIMQDLVSQLGLRQSVLKVGLDYHVGSAGARLSPVLRQKIALVRCLLKGPDLMVVHDATAGLDAASEDRILARLREHLKGRGLLWTVSRPALAERFDRALVVEDGRVVEQGSYAELSARPESAMARMLEAN
jgi:energy-coupling factor transporter ATP-binding protein EcfA2